MEKNHKNTDCYFFYYSTCRKGDSCAYRHEASALGCETVCSYWQQGSCLNQHCNFRHMEIKKNRKVIPCYWEKFPTGCKKPHCPFLHRLTRSVIQNPIEPVKATSAPAKPVNQEWTNRPDAKFDGNSTTESDPGRGSSEAGSFISSPVVDPLIVNFEEESDSEGAPSPSKNSINSKTRISSCKTYEEIRLEEIQAESAAFYSYEPSDVAGEYQNADTAVGKVKKLTGIRSQRVAVSSSVYGRGEEQEKTKNDTDELNFQVLSLEEIRRRRKKKLEEKAAMDEEKEEKEKKNDEYLRDAVKTLDHLRDTVSSENVNSTIITQPKRKRRSFDTVQEKKESETPAKRLRTEGARVPPVRLKRPGRIVVPTEEDKMKEKEEMKKAEEEVEEKRKAKERLEEKSTEEVTTRQGVEVRVCDSSTDDNQSDESLTDKDKKTPPALDSPAVLEEMKTPTECDSAAQGNELLDTAEDILKDIDALLS